jgi:endonuclease/exonuclease/phosphatase family metal-dependent hydrolase
MPKLKLYSHNVCWTRRKKSSAIIANKIQELQPDIACLQECGFASQIKQLNQLTDYHLSFVPVKNTKLSRTMAVMLREKSKVGTSGGLIVATKIKPIKVEFVKFQKQIKPFPHPLAYIVEKAITRGFLVLELESYYVLNVHLTADFKKKWQDKNLAISESQSLEIINYVATLNDKPVIITGDFNFTPSNTVYRELDKTNLIDISSNIPFTYIDRKAKLDYIFCNLRTYTTEVRLVNFIKQPSDHFALLAEIEY